jgi:pimeloyl-ACP methyl ester carboxylesterase
MSGVTEREIRVNGESCRIWEKGSGAPVGFLAGLGGVPKWLPFLDRLAARRRVVVPSLPGFPGGKGHDRCDTHLDWIAATLDLLDGAGLSGADLIGASVGGALAAEAAALSPASIRRLALIAPFGLYDAKAPPVDLFAQKPGALPALLCADAARFADLVAAPEGANSGEWSIMIARANEAAARLLWPLGDTRLGRRLHRIKCPTVILWGEADKVLPPSYAARFASAIGDNAQVKMITGAGHLAYLDAPDATADGVISALG